MSIQVTVSDLQERVRIDCGLPAYTSSTNITSTYVLDFIRRSAQKLAGLIQQSGAGEHYLTLNTDLATVANIPVVSLPTNTIDVVRLAMLFDGDREMQLHVAPLGDWDPDNHYWGTDTVPSYRVIGNTITLFPTPTGVRTIRCYYTVGFTVSSTSDTLALRPNWDEYIVANTCVLVRNRQKEDATEFLRSLAMCEAAITSQLKRDRAGIRQVRDVREPVFGRRSWWFR